MSGGEIEFRGTDRFEVVRRLGAGGMGVVYEALDRDKNARVALKTLRNLDAQALFLFKKEFRALQDVQHPNLISLGELIEERGQWFFTMELVRGVDFLTYVRPAGYATEDEATFGAGAGFAENEAASDTRPSPRPTQAAPLPFLDEARLRGALVQLAHGLVSLHAGKKIHRDIKPSNILVTPAGRVVLVDFGLVTEIAAVISTDKVIVGTVAYMAPEQAGWRVVGPPADWYSVGVLLYCALTGRLPFDGSPVHILMAKQNRPAPRPRAEPAGGFDDLEALCAELLEVDPAKRPSGPEVIRRLEGGTERHPSRSSFPKARDPFIGRHDELAMLRGAFDEARAGSAVVVCVQGESGVGKSALVKRFTESFSAQEVVVLAGRCYERESVPYKAVDGVIDALSQFLEQLGEGKTQDLLPRMAALLPQVFPVLGRVEGFAQTLPSSGLGLDAQELRARAFTALRELFTKMAAWRALVLVIDDLQWADADSLALLVELLRAPDPPPLLLVCTMRSGAGPFRIPGDVRYAELGRLAPAEALELASELMASGDERPSEPGSGRPSAAAIAREAGGHPLFIDELVRHSRRVQGNADAEHHLDDALSARVARLDDGARRLLEAVCVAGAPLSQAIAASAVGERDFAEIAKVMGVLRVANFVRTGGSRRTESVEPYHDRVREAVVANLAPAERRSWHAHLARAFEELHPEDAEALAEHFAAAGDRAKAARYATQAARQAESSFAFGRAAALFRTALELGGQAGEEARLLHTRLAHALANAGRGTEAAREYLGAVPGASDEDALDLRRRAADQLLRSGHVDEGLEVLRSVLEAIEMSLPRTHKGALASLLWQRVQLGVRGHRFGERGGDALDQRALFRIDVSWSVAIGLSFVDFIRCADFHTRTMRLALDAGDVDRISRSYAMASCIATSEGGAARARGPGLLETAEGLARRVGSSYTLAWIPLARATSEFMLGRWKSCLAQCEASDALFSEHGRGVAWERTCARVYGIWALGYLGDYLELARRIEGGLHEAHERGDRLAEVHLRTGAAHYVHLANDDPRKARSESAEALRDWSHTGFHIQHMLDLFAQTEAHLYEGDAVAAHALVARKWRELEAAMFLRLQNARIFMLDLRARTEIALAATRSGDPVLLRAAERRARKVEAEQMAWGSPLAWTLLAGIARQRGDASTAASLLGRASGAFRAADMSVHALAAERSRGRVLGGDEGGAIVQRVDESLTAQGVRAPARMALLFTPGVAG